MPAQPSAAWAAFKDRYTVLTKGRIGLETTDGKGFFPAAFLDDAISRALISDLVSVLDVAVASRLTDEGLSEFPSLLQRLRLLHRNGELRDFDAVFTLVGFHSREILQQDPSRTVVGSGGTQGRSILTEGFATVEAQLMAWEIAKPTKDLRLEVSYVFQGWSGFDRTPIGKMALLARVLEADARPIVHFSHVGEYAVPAPDIPSEMEAHRGRIRGNAPYIAFLRGQLPTADPKEAVERIGTVLQHYSTEILQIERRLAEAPDDLKQQWLDILAGQQKTVAEMKEIYGKFLELAAEGDSEVDGNE